MFFGLSNASAIVLRYINKILIEKFIIFIIIYLDNILINIKNLDKLYVEAV